jgi:hypothetical protein
MLAKHLLTTSKGGDSVDVFEKILAASTLQLFSAAKIEDDLLHNVNAFPKIYTNLMELGPVSSRGCTLNAIARNAKNSPCTMIAICQASVGESPAKVRSTLTL